MTAIDLEEQLANKIAEFYGDMESYVRYAFPWGEKGGPLEGHDGPDVWQLEQMHSIAKHIHDDPLKILRDATASGHGIGKTAQVAWIILWLMSTRPHISGQVTANTWPQLKTKTWRELAVWHKRAINKHWFKWTETRFSHIDHPETWYFYPIANSEHNSQSFAGQHEKHAVTIYDEGSEIPDSIWEVTNGIKDPRFMWFVFGNPTQNTGAFKECFGRLRGRWTTRNVDSRTCKMPDKAELQADVDEYGEDSDRVRIRIRGMFPRLGDAQFISSEVVANAIKRNATVPFGTPKIMGVDVARFGPDQTVFARRHGRKLEPLLKFRGLNTMQVAARIIEEKRKNNIDIIMIDGVGLGAGVVDRCRQLGHEVIEVLSGTFPDNENKDVVYNKRAEMWYRMRDWLDTAEIPDDAELDADLTGIRNTFDTKHRIQMEKKSDMKKRGLASPDCGDALALTFSYNTPPVRRGGGSTDPQHAGDY